MTLIEIFNIVSRILSEVGNILGITQTIQGQTKGLFTEADAALQFIPVGQTQLIVSDATFGNAALYALIVANQATLVSQLIDLSTQVGTPQQAGDPVTLPTTPPSGYGGGSSTLTAADVWDFPDGDGSAMGDNLRSADRILQNWASGTKIEVVGQPYLAAIDFLGWDRAGGADYFPFDALDAGTIIHADHNFSDWVRRAYPGYGWFDLTIDGAVVQAYQDQNVDHVKWCQDITQAEFEALKAQNDGLFIPVIWPGDTFVTFGTPVALDTLVVIPVACEGVILEVTAVPPGQAFYGFGDQPSYRFIGALAFGSLEGYMEQAQNFGFATAVFVPKTMAIAGVIQVRAAPGVTGTITPWSFS